MDSNKRMGRLAGLLFLILIITGVFAEFFVRQKLYVPEDPSATTQNIMDNQWLFRLGFVSDLIMSTMFFIYGYVLYLIFKPVHKNIALFLLLCTVISVAMFCQNALNQFAALEVLIHPEYTEAFKPEQLQVLAIFYQNLHIKGYYINQIFFGLYLLPLGYMIIKSGIVPKIIGIFLILGFIGDMIDFVVYFLYPNADSILLDNITIPADIGEISLCLYFLIMGVRSQKIGIGGKEPIQN
tara:strand:+ start:1758 stop:2474 length:717 start_codon:yes stop_codon:yes gene_type:complete